MCSLVLRSCHFQCILFFLSFKCFGYSTMWGISFSGSYCLFLSGWLSISLVLDNFLPLLYWIHFYVFNMEFFFYIPLHLINLVFSHCIKKLIYSIPLYIFKFIVDLNKCSISSDLMLVSDYSVFCVTCFIGKEFHWDFYLTYSNFNLRKYLFALFSLFERNNQFYCHTSYQVRQGILSSQSQDPPVSALPELGCALPCLVWLWLEHGLRIKVTLA